MDDDIPITVTMPPVDESGTLGEGDSLDASRTSSYSPLPPANHDLPLLEGGELDAQHHLSPGHYRTTSRTSFDSTMSSAENSSLSSSEEDPSGAYQDSVVPSQSHLRGATGNPNSNPICNKKVTAHCE